MHTPTAESRKQGDVLPSSHLSRPPTKGWYVALLKSGELVKSMRFLVATSPERGVCRPDGVVHLCVPALHKFRSQLYLAVDSYRRAWDIPLYYFCTPGSFYAPLSPLCLSPLRATLYTCFTHHEQGSAHGYVLSYTMSILGQIDITAPGREKH